jgi:hypothetical protein
VVFVLAGCEWLADIPQPSQVGSTDATAGMCSAETECASGVCDLATGECVECIRRGDVRGPGADPVRERSRRR